MIMLDRADPLDRLREAIGADGFASAWEAGSALTMDDAIEMALEETLAPTAPASRPPPNQLGVAEPLSARELEVLRLIAEGLPDREIADALFISRRTSTTHVTHILNKLGVNSRSAAVALGMRLGLI
jgi:DNA-binding CsgD family transcriptional regulator